MENFSYPSNGPLLYYFGEFQPHLPIVTFIPYNYCPLPQIPNQITNHRHDKELQDSSSKPDSFSPLSSKSVDSSNLSKIGIPPENCEKKRSKNVIDNQQDEEYKPYF